MPDLMSATHVEAGDRPGHYRAVLSPEWAVWGPNGGYVAAIALRAALRETRHSRPGSFYAHFLAVGEFGPVELEVTRLGGSKRADSLRVDLRQEDRLLLSATVWAVDDSLAGYEHDQGVAPAVPGPGELLSYAERAGEEYENWYPIWRSIEGKPVKWREDEGPGKAEWDCWLCLTDTPIPDVEADAVRQLFWLDMPGWNATVSAHSWPFPYLAPNLDLMIQFHRFAPEERFTLAHGDALIAKDGLVGCVSRLWTEDGRLLATGSSKHIFRPNPGYAEELERARAEGLLPEEPGDD